LKFQFNYTGIGIAYEDAANNKTTLERFHGMYFVKGFVKLPTGNNVEGC
jgi:hypothetical protein